MVFTFVLTAFFNTELGLEFGILASIVVLVWQISSLDVAAVRPTTALSY
jgi:MFS superfamily sulfate permease-like transporter